MSKPRVYVETTIPNFYYDLRKSRAVIERRESTRHWWQKPDPGYERVTGPPVLEELNAGTGSMVAARLALIEMLPVLPVVEGIAEIAEVYIRNKLMPASPTGDALHLALASFHECDFIVTWNCKHLANPNKFSHIQRINHRLGLAVPGIVTPSELLGS